MHHALRSIIAIIVLVLIVVALGVLVGKSGITGGTVVDTIACYDHADCDDQIAATDDVCKNPGTLSSLCINRPKE